MDDAKLAAALTKDGKPAGLVGRVRLFVDSAGDLFVNDVKNSIVDSWWYRHVSKNPGDMFSDRHANRWEEVLAEQAFLCFVPGKSVLVNHHEMMHESLFLGGEETLAGWVVATGRQEVNREWR
jgi:hypothetical protein